MKRWLPMVFALGLAVLARWAIAPPSLPAVEADTLAAAQLFAHALAGDAPAGQRLRAAFRPDPKQPRVAQLKGGRAWRAVGSSPPLPRWVGGLGASVAAGDTVLEGARWGAALAVALALALLAWAAGRVPRPAGGLQRGALAWPALLTLAALPGTLQAATGAGYGAAALLASAALLAATRWLAAGRRAGGWASLAVGVALGLTWGVHPAAFALVIPVFIVLALAGRPAEAPRPPLPGAAAGSPGDDPAPGTLPLPWVPLTALAAPLVALTVLVALWPALWSHTGKGLLAWATDTWRLAAPAQAVAGVAFDQLHGRAPQAWTALYQWTTWTPLTLLGAWLVGLGVTLRAGRRGWWFPVLALATLLIVAGLNGGLFGFRNSLLAMTLPFTAATAAVGAAATARWLVARLGGGRLTRVAVWGMIALLGLAPVLYEQATEGYVPRGGPNGAEVALPLPLPLVEEIALTTPKTTVAVVGGGSSWRRSFEILWGAAGVRLNLRAPETARWLILMDDPDVPGVLEALRDLGQRAPALRAVAGGVPFVAYDRGPATRRPTTRSKPSKARAPRPRGRVPTHRARSLRRRGTGQQRPGPGGRSRPPKNPPRKKPHR